MNQATQNIEDIFSILDQSSTYIAEQFQKTYLEALIDTGEQLFQQEIVIAEATEEQASALHAMYQAFVVEKYTQEDVRRGFQLAVLKGMKEEQVIPGSGLTPDSVVMFMGYLVQKLWEAEQTRRKQQAQTSLQNENIESLSSVDRSERAEQEESMTICDPAIGVGNLLTGVLNYLNKPNRTIGTEVDPILVRLAYVNANLQQHEVELFHQDGLKPLFTEQCDVVVCDLPVGRYPNEKVARGFELYKEGEDMYTHHLFIEQALRNVKDGGYLFFIIPNSLFTEDGSERLRTFITEKAYIQALLQIPEHFFQKGSIHKSIFILQKKGKNISKPQQTLLAQLPSFGNQEKMVEMLKNINQWIQTEKG